MNILVLHGSPRAGGNTEILARQFLDRLGGGHRIEERRLADPGLEFCLGCRACFDRGESACPRRDGLLDIRDAMLHADLLILTSPVYVGDCSAIVKNWIDRMAFTCHRPAFAGKSAWLLLSAGSFSSMGHAFATMATALSTWGYRVVGKRELICGARLDAAGMATRFGKLLEHDAGKLAKALRAGWENRPGFLSLLTFAIQRRGYLGQAADTVDSRYWKDRGWLEPGSRWYRPCRPNPLKLAAARMTGSLMVRLFGL